MRSAARRCSAVGEVWGGEPLDLHCLIGQEIARPLTQVDKHSVDNIKTARRSFSSFVSFLLSVRTSYIVSLFSSFCPFFYLHFFPSEMCVVLPNSSLPVLFIYFFMFPLFSSLEIYVAPQWGAADAEIKVPSGENTKLKRSPFKAWSRSVYSHTCYAYCHGFFPCLFLPFWSIYLHFSKPLPIFPVLAVPNTYFRCRPAE